MKVEMIKNDKITMVPMVRKGDNMVVCEFHDKKEAHDFLDALPGLKLGSFMISFGDDIREMVISGLKAGWFVVLYDFLDGKYR